MALEPETQALANIRAWIAERWNVTIKPLDFDSGINNRQTVAWHDESTLYLPRARLREAAGGVLKESAIAETLGRLSLLTRREDQYRRHVRYVPKIGKVDAMRSNGQSLVGPGSSMTPPTSARMKLGSQPTRIEFSKASPEPASRFWKFGESSSSLA